MDVTQWRSISYRRWHLSEVKHKASVGSVFAAGIHLDVQSDTLPIACGWSRQRTYSRCDTCLMS